MNKNVLIVEDNVQHYGLMEKGVKLFSSDINIVKVDIKEIISAIEKNNISIIPNNIDLFIIDVCLRKDDELGLNLFSQLKKREEQFPYILKSAWDFSEFKDEIKNEINENYFVNSNNYLGFELKLKIRHLLEKLWK